MSIARIPAGAKAATLAYRNWIFTKQFTAEGSFEEQVNMVLTDAFLAAKQAGAVKDSIVKCDVVLRDAARAADVLAAYQKIICCDFPAIKVQTIANLPVGTEVGVELTAVTADSGLVIERVDVNAQGIPAAVRAGDYIYTSLQLPDEKGDFAAEAAQVVDKAVAAVVAAGGTAEKVVKNFALITEISNFDPFNAVYAQTFRIDNDPPARSLIGVSQIGGGYQVAMECIAYVGECREAVSIGALKGKMPFCSAMRGGDFLFISGQIGVLNMDGTYNVELQPQTEHLYRVIHAVAEAGGCSSSSYLKCNGFYIQPEYESVMKEQLAIEMAGNECAEALFPVPFLANAAILVEMDLVAAVEE